MPGAIHAASREEAGLGGSARPSTSSRPRGEVVTGGKPLTCEGRLKAPDGRLALGQAGWAAPAG